MSYYDRGIIFKVVEILLSFDTGALTILLEIQVWSWRLNRSFLRAKNTWLYFLAAVSLLHGGRSSLALYIVLEPVDNTLEGQLFCAVPKFTFPKSAWFLQEQCTSVPLTTDNHFISLLLFLKGFEDTIQNLVGICTNEDTICSCTDFPAIWTKSK